jgi:hypothetical protein
VGSLQGQANCIIRLGDIALERSQGAETKKNFEAALTLYERIEEPFLLVGLTGGWLAFQMALSVTVTSKRRVQRGRKSLA